MRLTGLTGLIVVSSTHGGREKPKSGFTRAVNSFSVRQLRFKTGPGILLTLDPMDADRCSESYYIPWSTMDLVKDGASESSLTSCALYTSESAPEVISRYNIRGELQCGKGKEQTLFCTFGESDIMFGHRRMTIQQCPTANCPLMRVPCGSGPETLNNECAHLFIGFKEFVETNDLVRADYITPPTRALQEEIPAPVDAEPIPSPEETVEAIVPADPVPEPTYVETIPERRLGEIVGANKAGLRFVITDQPVTRAIFIQSAGDPCEETLDFPDTTTNVLFKAVSESRVSKCNASVHDFTDMEASWNIQPVVDCSDPNVITLSCSASIGGGLITSSRRDSQVEGHASQRPLRERVSCGMNGQREMLECASLFHNYFAVRDLITN
jgi:hypothetical protein